MSTKICVIMDPPNAIHVKKDTTVAILLEAQKRQWEIYYLQPQDLILAKNTVYGLASRINVQDNSAWLSFIDSPQKIPLATFDITLMRKDPPFDTLYLYTTYLLEIAQANGAYIVNDPRSIRDANEKLFTAWFPACCPPTLVSSKKWLLREFLDEHQHIVVKGLHSLGGQAVFSLDKNNPNINVTLETLTNQETCPIMAQRFLPEIAAGDKRILMIAGKPYPYAISRIPAQGDFRGNLAQGGKGVGCKLTPRDEWICQQVGPILREKALHFVGLDVIGDYLTEINVTSPTGVREIEAAFQVNITAEILDRLLECREKIQGLK